MKDKEFLLWLVDRLIYVYHEDSNADFIWKLRCIAKSVGNKETLNTTQNAAPLLDAMS